MGESAKIVMIATNIEIMEFIARVAAKFNVPARRLKCKFKDEDGQIMDLNDQDELEMLVELAKEDAKLNRREFGRAEVLKPFSWSRLMGLDYLHCIKQVSFYVPPLFVQRALGYAGKLIGFYFAFPIRLFEFAFIIS